MPKPGTDWTPTNMNAFDLRGDPIARVFGWTLCEHPELGDEHPILAVSFDRIGDNGPIVYNTHDFDVPEFL